MRILHTSDWHLGAVDNEHSLLEDQHFFIKHICDIIVEGNIDAVFIAGDIYDRSVASLEATRLFDKAMTDMCLDLGVKVFIIAGNHDSAERLSTCNKLLQKAGLYIKGELDKNIEPLVIDNTQIYMLPWITTEKVRSVFFDVADKIGNLTSAYRVVTDKMRATFKEGMRHIILSHAFITDSETSTSDRSAVIGTATQVPASVFEGFDYVALGHIHKPQDVNDKIRYSGTLMPYSFGKEEKQVKSVTIIDTKTMSREILPVKLFRHRNSFEGTLDQLLNPKYNQEDIDGYVKLIITDAYVGLDILSRLKNIYPNILEVSGKTYVENNGIINLSIDELSDLTDKPIEIFKHFCNEKIGVEPTKEQVELFRIAIESCSTEGEK